MSSSGPSSVSTSSAAAERGLGERDAAHVHEVVAVALEASGAGATRTVT